MSHTHIDGVTCAVCLAALAASAITDLRRRIVLKELVLTAGACGLPPGAAQPGAPKLCVRLSEEATATAADDRPRIAGLGSGGAARTWRLLAEAAAASAFGEHHREFDPASSSLEFAGRAAGDTP